MKTICITALLSVMVVGMCGTALAGDTLENAKKKGVLIAGVSDSKPFFGYIDEKTHEFVGYDIDFARAIAGRLGVKLEFKSVTEESRIPELILGNIDIIAATLTNTSERAKLIDFSYIYFITGQKFLTEKGTVKNLADLEGKRIGTARGSTSEHNVKKALPKAIVLPFNDYLQAFSALRQGKLFAVTTDESILLTMLAQATDKERFEIPAIQISGEPYGLGIRKGDKNFLDFVNNTLLEMEKSGEVKRLFEKWFGPHTAAPMERTFVIAPEK